MEEIQSEEIKIVDPELEMLRLNRQSGYNYRRRRQADWLENYTLYRDRVTINRLTQRQTVNIPLMKQSVRTLLKDVDDMPVIYFENLDNDRQAEIFQNEHWRITTEENHMELQDIVDKRQVFLFGRTFDQWQIVDGKIKMTVQDPQDMLVSRHCDPFDLNSSRFLIHTHIFVPLSTLKNNPDYDQAEVKKLEKFYGTLQGILKKKDNVDMMVEKNEKMQEMGVPDVADPVLGETYVELSLQFLYREDEKDKDDKKLEEQLFLYVEADDQVILMKKPLEEILGVTEDNYWRNHYPYVSWGDDVERQDFWSDGIGDIIRGPNKVVNSWYSQLVENRTLRNYGMHYFDSSDETFMPQTFAPVPWGWYPVPGKPSDVLQKVDIPDLSESLDEMQFVIQISEKASGATATQQGVQTERKITLGEVELALNEAKERVKGMSKFYTPAWKQRSEIFLKLIEGRPDLLDAVKIYKKGRNTRDIFSREIDPKDWMTKLGYRTRVWSQDEKNAQDTETLNKLNAVKSVMPDNPKLAEVYNRKLLEFVDLSPEEINDIMEFEEQKREMMAANPLLGAGQPSPQGQPAQSAQPTQPLSIQPQG